MRRTLLDRAARMRREPTEPERLLRLELKDRRLGGFKFRRQTTIGNRIVDFFCPEKGLVIEIDGHTHDRERDLSQDAELERRTGFRTVRFTNGDVMHNREGVKLALLAVLQASNDRWGGRCSTTPNPLL
ncbi:endonuclease domain-containing protein [Novosphingobium sp.]|uniref:endonuclease domain-containing protein n=1 Tax=Novosphingobium sp. TaxID=1874826 RepID=UPI001D7216D3|nr:endonuclease domain-containing protein [Novosphingobium sp.]MBX9663830.1 endonuclease domain-containing protein [Novosphingobium sp.]